MHQAYADVPLVLISACPPLMMCDAGLVLQSYMLAALVVLLLHEFFNGQSELRVVYIPDSSLLLVDFVEGLQRSLLLAFADDPQSCQIITEAKTADDLKAFLGD